MVGFIGVMSVAVALFGRMDPLPFARRPEAMGCGSFARPSYGRDKPEP